MHNDVQGTSKLLAIIVDLLDTLLEDWFVQIFDFLCQFLFMRNYLTSSFVISLKNNNQLNNQFAIQFNKGIIDTVLHISVIMSLS